MCNRIYIEEVYKIINDLNISNNISSFHSYSYLQSNATFLINLSEISPPKRDGNLIWFRSKDNVKRILFAMSNRDLIDPIQVWSKNLKANDLYVVRDGFHRFYLSIVMGYRFIPVTINDWDFEN